jgi:lipopolysaccharide/colanic/teichoic acid biosynthesis glycosyltransferase
VSRRVSPGMDAIPRDFRTPNCCATAAGKNAEPVHAFASRALARQRIFIVLRQAAAGRPRQGGRLFGRAWHVVRRAPQNSVTGKSILHRQRVQLGGAFLFAVALPFLARITLLPAFVEADFITAVVGVAAAVVFGHYMFRSLTVYPGIEAGFFVLPSFVISFALVMVTFWVFRLGYSRFLFGLGFVVAILWYFFLFFWLQRKQSLRIGVVPFGGADALRQIESVDWTVLDKPDKKKALAFDAIAADFRWDLPDEWERFLADCALRGVIVYHCKQLHESLTGRVEIDHLSENTFGSLIPALVYVKLKRLADFCAAIVGGVLMLPLLLVSAIAIRLDSPGPIFFRQDRVGAGGRVFRVWKFRTMAHDTRRATVAELRHAITVEDDPRVTRVGRFLRRTRIDELPQILNILTGEMSWIGPRPEAEVLSKWYESELPFYRYRHVVKPGISGWAQVNQGHVAEMDQVLGKLQYDFYYIKYFSPWLDVLILFKTIATVLNGRGVR